MPSATSAECSTGGSAIRHSNGWIRDDVLFARCSRDRSHFFRIRVDDGGTRRACPRRRRQPGGELHDLVRPHSSRRYHCALKSETTNTPSLRVAAWVGLSKCY